MFGANWTWRSTPGQNAPLVSDVWARASRPRQIRRIPAAKRQRRANRPFHGRARPPARKARAGPAPRTRERLLLLDRELEPFGRDLEVRALRRARQEDRNAVGVGQRGRALARPGRRSRAAGGVDTVEVLELFQVVDVALGLDVRESDLADRES